MSLARVVGGIDAVEPLALDSKTALGLAIPNFPMAEIRSTIIEKGAGSDLNGRDCIVCDCPPSRGCRLGGIEVVGGLVRRQLYSAHSHGRQMGNKDIRPSTKSNISLL